MQALLISGGEQCIGFAINGSEFEKPENNPAITCDCTYDKNTTCHITKLRVHALDKRGVFPKEFEALRYLAVLYEVFPTPFSYKRHRKLDLNYFTGPLPAFIGNMSALKVFYMDSCGFGGEIPSTFAKLINMKILYASDNPFSGKIPAFTGDWRKLRWANQ
ncbi:PREDICTED: probable LRR receptor-like serine/threonine-protein kinase At1g56140 [Prunus mume]|uniref:Probable LRR receptor-like serine/threonine-protein kinase At1g56140 n=1 Tax=Prunus mume TaxID=102107 RepID=A0ABM1LT07_PRUMU|nr:PREDICTED: probable LRR receptor-like serine/threonine-protein kinase At1g56140 [Prunus mume]